MEQCGARPHGLEPLQSIVVRVYLEWHLHEVWSELCNGPDNGEAFQLSGGIIFFGLVQRPRCTADDAFFSFPDSHQDCAEACGRRVRVQTEGEAEVGDGGDGAGGEERFELIEGLLTVGAPMEDHILPGQGMQRTGDGCKILNISPVIPGKTQEGADFGGIFGRLDLPDGCQE